VLTGTDINYQYPKKVIAPAGLNTHKVFKGAPDQEDFLDSLPM
jgi:hypothetical protein